jgi:hypothetical protein
VKKFKKYFCRNFRKNEKEKEFFSICRKFYLFYFILFYAKQAGLHNKGMIPGSAIGRYSPTKNPSSIAGEANSQP